MLCLPAGLRRPLSPDPFAPYTRFFLYFLLRGCPLFLPTPMSYPAPLGSLRTRVRRARSRNVPASSPFQCIALQREGTHPVDAWSRPMRAYTRIPPAGSACTRSEPAVRPGGAQLWPARVVAVGGEPRVCGPWDDRRHAMDGVAKPAARSTGQWHRRDPIASQPWATKIPRRP